MADRDAILAYADELLDLAAFPDYGPMGMQVAGARTVDRITCGVSCSLEMFERTAAVGAQLLLVHHGLFWDRDSRVIDDALRTRLKVLLDAEVTLAAYHLALDAHGELGNNALLARELGIEPSERFADIGFGGPLAEPSSVGDFSARVGAVLGREPLVFAHGPDPVRRAAVITGGAGRYLAEAAQAGYDLFLTGEPEEPSLHTARELGITFVAGGHYATERIGIQALARRLADEFHVEWEFIDLPNPV